MLSSRKRTTDKNEKDGRKSSVKSVKSSVDNEKATTSKKLEKTPKLHVDLEKDSKAIPSSTKKIVSSVVKSNVSADRLQNKIKALKGNHQVVTNTKDLPIKRKVDNDSSKVALVKKSTSSLVRKSSSKHSDTISNKNNVAKKPLTNVTINSPKQKRKELQLNSAQENRDEEKYFGTSNDEQIVKNSARSKNNVSEKQEINLNNHKRYRTRTLEPEEIKIIDKLVQNIEYSDNNISEVNVNRKLLAQPKAFFISLDEQNKAHGSKEKNTDQKQDDKNKEDENDALSYEDDFESYESDFESFNSSDKSSKVSESEIDEVSSTTSGLSSLNNINQNKVKDDKIFDSGNYELGESQKTIDTKSNVSPQRINENVSANNPKTEYLPQSMASLTDEGFDENSAGPLCSINNISISSKTESNIIHNDDNINNKSNYSQRARDLKELIVLDHVKYFLFEMFPMSYDSFIMIHGKSNMKQVMCQTNDDYIDEDVQTDLISVENKWTQHPIEFSDSNIIFGKNDDKDKKNYTKDKFSPLEIYVSQKSGCGSDSLVTNTEIKNKLSIVHRTNFAKLTKFIDKTGKCILNYLDDIQRFSSEDTTALRENPVNEKHPYNENEKYIYEIIKQRPLEKIQFSKMDSNIILTIHPVKSEHISKKPNIDMCSIICTWFLKGNLLKPSKMLGTIGNIKCCEISKGLSGIVVAGLEDGNVSAWNLKEQNMWFENLYSNMRTSPDVSNPDGIERELFRICSFHSGYDICKSSNKNRYAGGSCVEVLFSKSVSKNDTSAKDLSSTNQQIYLLQEFGLLTIWIVIHKQPAYKNATNIDNYHSQWSTISLVKTNVVNLNNFIFHNNEFKTSSSHKQIQLNTSNDKTERVNLPQDRNRQSKKGIMRAFADDELDIEIDDLITRKDQSKSKEIRDDSKEIDPINKIICTIMKEHHVTGDVLVACNNCQILSYSPRSIRKNVNFHKCEDTGSCVTCIETPSSDLPFFFSGCSNSIVHLYSKKSTKPLRSFFYGQSETDIQAYKQFTLSYDFYNFSNSGIDKVKPNFWIDWCELKSHMFFTFFADGTIALWDLFNSDTSPKMYFNYLINNNTGKTRFLLDGKILSYNQNRTGAVKYLMILHLSDGQIQLHMLDEKHFNTKFDNEEKELKLLKTYFELL